MQEKTDKTTQALQEPDCSGRVATPSISGESPMPLPGTEQEGGITDVPAVQTEHLID